MVHTGAHHRYLKYGREVQHVGDTDLILCPTGYIVTGPMAYVSTCAEICAPCYDQWALARPPVEKSIPGSRRHQGSVHVVRIVLHETIMMDEVGI